MTFLISFQLKRQHFRLRRLHFRSLLSPRNRFCPDESDSDDKFRSKKLIKSRFDKDIKQNLALDQLDHRSLLKAVLRIAATANNSYQMDNFGFPLQV